jgi:hypothetical protein
MTSMAFITSAPCCFQGTTTLSIKIFSTVAFSMTTVGISTLRIMAFTKMALCITTLSLIILGMAALSKKIITTTLNMP